MASALFLAETTFTYTDYNFKNGMQFVSGMPFQFSLEGSAKKCSAQIKPHEVAAERRRR
jgi:hypothetical protein